MTRLHAARLGIAFQAADLVTFLALVWMYPVVVTAEVGIIGSVYVVTGPVGAIAWKLALTAVVLWCADACYRKRPRLGAITLVLLFLSGFVGMVFNLFAAWEIHAWMTR